MVADRRVNLPAKAIRQQIAGAVDMVLQVSRMRDGARRITAITEIVGMEGEIVTTQDLFTFQYEGEGVDGKLKGSFKSSGLRPHFMTRAEYYGLDRALMEAMGSNRLGLDPMLVVLALGIGIALLCLFLAFGDETKKQQAKRVDRLKSRGRGDIVGEALQLRRETGDKGKISQLVLRYLPRPELRRERLHRTRPLDRPRRLWRRLPERRPARRRRRAGDGPLGAGGRCRGAAGGLGGVWLTFVGFRARRRANRFGNHFSEAVMLMVRGLKSGLPVTETFQVVGAEVPDPVGFEFRPGQRPDPPRPSAGAGALGCGAARRHAELESLVVTLSIQRETGGNLAEILSNLGGVIRRRKELRLKTKALSAEARASALVISALPFLAGGALFLISPNYARRFLADPRGGYLLAGALAELGLGIGIMRLLIKWSVR